MAAILILVAACLFGTSPIFGKIAYSYGVTPLILMTWRSTIATAAFWTAALLFRAVKPTGVRMLGTLVVLGATFVPMQVYSYFYALSLLPASTASVIVNTAPVHVAWMERLTLHETMAPAELVILGIIIAGAVLVAGATPHVGHPVAFAVLGAATLASGAYLVIQRHVVRDVPPLMIAAVIQTSAAAAYWSAVTVTHEAVVHLPPPAWAAIGGGALAGSTASFLVLVALRTLAATRAAILGMLEPIVTIVLSVLLLSDTMTWPRLAGIVVVLAGIATFYWRLRQPPDPIFVRTGSEEGDFGAI